MINILKIIYMCAVKSVMLQICTIALSQQIFLTILSLLASIRLQTSPINNLNKYFDI